MEPAHLAHRNGDGLFRLRCGDAGFWLDRNVERVCLVDGELMVHHLVGNDGSDVLAGRRENILGLRVETNHARRAPADPNLLVEYGFPTEKLVGGILIEHNYAGAGDELGRGEPAPIE